MGSRFRFGLFGDFAALIDEPNSVLNRGAIQIGFCNSASDGFASQPMVKGSIFLRSIAFVDFD